MRADSVPYLLETVAEAQPESDDARRALVDLAQAEGLSMDDLILVLEAVLYEDLSSSKRNALIAGALVPRGDYLIPIEAFSSILGAVGTPEVYYKAGKQHKLKRLAISTQQKLLDWLISALPQVEDVLKTLRRYLPVLFGLLSYEYLRPQIVCLIVIALGAPPAKGATTNVRPWHVHLVVDLSLRYPFDKPLQSLLTYFRRTLPASQTRQYLRLQLLPAVRGKYELPRNKFLKTLALESQFEAHILRVQSILTAILDDYDALSHPTKRKRDAVDGGMAVINSSNAMKLDSVAALVANFEQVSLTNPSSVLTLNATTYTSIYLTLKLLTTETNSAMVKKLAYAIKYHVLAPDNRSSLLLFLQFISFARHGGLRGPLLDTVYDFIAEKLPENSNLPLLLSHQLDLLQFFLLEDERASIAVPRILHNVVEAKLKSDDLIATFYTRLSFIFRKIRLNAPAPRGIASILPRVFDTTLELWRGLLLKAKLAFVSLLKSIKHLDYTDFDTSTLILPPSLMYQLIISTNPLVVSDAFGYISFLKTVTIPESDVAEVSLRNGFVMDAINLVWRDQAFMAEPDTFNRGMLLNSDFLERLGGLNFFSNSDLVQLKSVGGLVQNPAFAYLCAELVWKLEDLDERLTTRHPGPLSETTVAQLRQDPDATWLPMSYYDIKVSILNSLDELGFTGLCDLLFSSLRSLSDKRRSQVL